MYGQEESAVRGESIMLTEMTEINLASEEG